MWGEELWVTVWRGVLAFMIIPTTPRLRHTRAHTHTRAHAVLGHLCALRPASPSGVQGSCFVDLTDEPASSYKLKARPSTSKETMAGSLRWRETEAAMPPRSARTLKTVAAGGQACLSSSGTQAPCPGPGHLVSLCQPREPISSFLTPRKTPGVKILGTHLR